MKPERMQEIRRLANPATNARWLSAMLNETLDALEGITAGSARPTEEYGPGVVEGLLAGGGFATSKELYGSDPSDPDVITSATMTATQVTGRHVIVSPDPGEIVVTGHGTVAEKVGPEENDTRPMKRPGKERK